MSTVQPNSLLKISPETCLVATNVVLFLFLDLIWWNPSIPLPETLVENCVSGA